MYPWLIAAGQWVLRLFGGWFPIGNKPVGEWLGKILWVVGIVAACLFVWNKFTQPTTTKKQTVQKGGYAYDVIHNSTPRAVFGCANVRVYDYYMGNKEVPVK